MKANLLPLAGKYYGTTVQLTDDQGKTSELCIWHSKSTPGCPPSQREFESRFDPAQESLAEFIQETMSDPHYESEFALKIARLIVTAVNELPALLAENRRLREALELKQATETITPFGESVLGQLSPRKESDHGR